MGKTQGIRKPRVLWKISRFLFVCVCLYVQELIRHDGNIIKRWERMSGGDDTFLDVSTFTYGRPRQTKKTKNGNFQKIFFLNKMKSVWAKKKKTKQMVGFRLFLNVRLVRFSLDGQQLPLLSYSIHEPCFLRERKRDRGTDEEQVHSCVIYKYIVSKHLDALWLYKQQQIPPDLKKKQNKRNCTVVLI